MDKSTDDVGASAVLRHLQIDAQRCDRTVGVRELRRHPVADGVRLVPRRSEAPHDDLGVGPERPDELGHVHPGAAVDVRRVLPGQKINAHVENASTAPRLPLL